MDTLGGSQQTTIINESGLYNVILRSDKPKAKEFKRWVTHEVLPAIHKHGAYAVDELLDDPELAIKAFTALKEEREKRKALELENAQQKQIIGELQPKANYVDIILDNKGLVTITQIAKDYGMSGQKMNKLLSDLGVQFKQSGQWLLYRKYHDEGYTHSKTIDIVRSDGRPDVVMETKWTQKGRLFLYELLKDNGIIPVIERDMSTGAGGGTFYYAHNTYLRNPAIKRHVAAHAGRSRGHHQRFYHPPGGRPGRPKTQHAFGNRGRSARPARGAVRRAAASTA